MGFQSCSTKITVSAPVRFKPSPPTVVVSSSRSIDGSSLNLPTKILYIYDNDMMIPMIFMILGE